MVLSIEYRVLSNSGCKWLRTLLFIGALCLVACGSLFAQLDGGTLTGGGGAGAPGAPIADSTQWRLSGDSLFPKNLSNNVGIGTASPVFKLQVHADNSFQANDASGNTLGQFQLINGLGSYVRIALGDVSEVYDTTQIRIEGGNLGNSGISIKAPASKVLLQPTAGNVGIGTASPAYKLDVNGIIYSNQQLAVNAVDTMTIEGDTLISQIENHSNVRAVIESHTLSDNDLSSVIYNAKARGTINAPAVVQTGDQLGVVGALGYNGTDYSVGGYEVFTVADSTPGIGSMGTDWSLVLADTGTSGGSPVVTVLHNGNMGIGTASPLFKLHVVGNLLIDSDDGAGTRGTTLFSLNTWTFNLLETPVGKPQGIYFTQQSFDNGDTLRLSITTVDDIDTLRLTGGASDGAIILSAKRNADAFFPKTVVISPDSTVEINNHLITFDLTIKDEIAADAGTGTIENLPTGISGDPSKYFVVTDSTGARYAVPGWLIP